MAGGLDIAFFGSSLVSAYWNGAATYYRGIIRALHKLGIRVTFYEPDAYDRQLHRDMPDPSWARVVVYPADEDGVRRALESARQADVLVKASGVGASMACWKPLFRRRSGLMPWRFSGTWMPRPSWTAWPATRQTPSAPWWSATTWCLPTAATHSCAAIRPLVPRSASPYTTPLTLTLTVLCRLTRASSATWPSWGTGCPTARHGWRSSSVKGTGTDGQPGVLRIYFPDYSVRGSLEEISWDEFFRKFEESRLAFLYQEETRDNQPSRFFKLIRR